VIDLYFMPGAASLAPHVVLEEVGADYRLIRGGTADPAGEDAVKAKAEADLAGMRGFLEGEFASGGPYLLGERFTSADVYLFPLTRWGRRVEPKWWDQAALGAHFRRVLERPAAQRAGEQEGLDPYP